MNVVIADGKAEVRSALRLLLSQQEGTAIVEAHDVVSLLDSVRATRPTLVLVEWELADPRPAGARGASLPGEIAALAPHARVIVLGNRIEAKRAALAAGADAFCCKGGSPDCLLAELQATITGGE